jgi:hypothetical protein
MSNVFISCPHCEQAVEVLAVNCRIFRCGVYISNNKQINPHMSQENCIRLQSSGLIYGCGKPFKLEPVDPTDNSGSLDASYNVVKCGYI